MNKINLPLEIVNKIMTFRERPEYLKPFEFYYKHFKTAEDNFLRRREMHTFWREFGLLKEKFTRYSFMGCDNYDRRCKRCFHDMNDDMTCYYRYLNNRLDDYVFCCRCVRQIISKYHKTKINDFDNYYRYSCNKYKGPHPISTCLKQAIFHYGLHCNNSTKNESHSFSYYYFDFYLRNLNKRYKN